MSDEPRPERMALEALADACQRESSRFFRREESDERFCYELFRRALAARNQYAWERLWQVYENLVRGWLRRRSAYDLSQTSMDELVTQSFEKFWHGVSSGDGGFERFPSLPKLLQYLQLCTATLVTDARRRHMQDRRLNEMKAAYAIAAQERPDWDVPSQEERIQLWARVLLLCNDEQEEGILYYSFVLSMKPAEIVEQLPTLCADVKEIYRIKRNLLSRFRRDPELQRFWNSMD